MRLNDADRERFAHVLYGHANLYGLFVGAGLASLDDDGVLAAVVPTSFISGRYFENLRTEIARSAPLRDITFVSDRAGVFSTVLQETCLGVFTRRPAQRTTVASMDADGIHPVASVKARRRPGPWVLPRRADDAPWRRPPPRCPCRCRPPAGRRQPAHWSGTAAKRTCTAVPPATGPTSSGLPTSTAAASTATGPATPCATWPFVTAATAKSWS